MSMTKVNFDLAPTGTNMALHLSVVEIGLRLREN